MQKFQLEFTFLIFQQYAHTYIYQHINLEMKFSIEIVPLKLSLSTVFSQPWALLEILLFFKNFVPAHYKGIFFSILLCKLSCSVMSNSLQSHGLQPARFLCPWDFPGNNTRMGCHFLLQGIFLTQGLIPHPLHLCIGRQILYHSATGEAQLFYSFK